MVGILCEHNSCKSEAYAKVAYCNKFLCFKHFSDLGDFDIKGRLTDKRIKRKS